jgi:hypothetical protein
MPEVNPFWLKFSELEDPLGGGVVVERVPIQYPTDKDATTKARHVATSASA